MTTPEIRIEHNLPNRARLRFSVPPRRYKKLTLRIRGLEGVEHFSYNATTRGALVVFDHQKIELLRILKTLVLELALEYGRQPVHVRTSNDSYHFTLLSLVSAGGILAAAAATLFAPTRLYTTVLRWSAVALTGGAIVEHASGEIGRTGSFDFENLSIVYLINSVPQNHLVRGVFATWVATFSRHLMPLKPQGGLKCEVIEGEDPKTGKRYDDVLISGSIDLRRLNGLQPPSSKSLVLRGLAHASWKSAVG